MLSVVCLTDDPGNRVAAALAPLRPLAGEIVVAADSRVDEADLRGYASVADRLHRIRFDYPERHVAWLHDQCRGDWVLRIDGDEVPSQALLDRLPELLADPDVLQHWLPRRWLDPAGMGWLDETPWTPDFQNRLVRRGLGLRFPGVLHTHASPALPARFVDGAPLYHLVCPLVDTATRTRRAAAYESRRPGLSAPGGGPLNAVYYHPEAHARRAPEPIPVEDLGLVRAVLAPAQAGGLLPRVPPITPDDEVDRAWGGAPLADGDYRAAVRVLERDIRAIPGRTLRIHAHVENRGGARWRGGADALPEIRLTHRWLDGEGVQIGPDRPRTPFPCDLPPGGATAVPLDVVAPRRTGDLLLELGLVHEHVRWLDARAEVPVRVVAPERDDVSAARGARWWRGWRGRSAGR